MFFFISSTFCLFVSACCLFFFLVLVCCLFFVYTMLRFPPYSHLCTSWVVLLPYDGGQVSPFLIPALISNTASGVVAIEHKARGPNFGVVSACATGTHAIGTAMDFMLRGEVRWFRLIVRPSVAVDGSFVRLFGSAPVFARLFDCFARWLASFLHFFYYGGP